MSGDAPIAAVESIDEYDLPDFDFPDEALPLVEIVTSADGGGGLEHGHGWSFRVGARACEVLARIPDRVCVIAVAGMYRTGKSSLLN